MKMNARVLVLLFATTLSPLGARAADGPTRPSPVPQAEACADGGDRQQTECLQTQIDRLQADLDQAYRAALAKLPDGADQDRRGTPEQLRASESAWRQYEEANCPLMGALQGGSSAWITHFAADCQAQEIASRTRMLQQIGDGTLGGH